jgi:hypothetical protein
MNRCVGRFHLIVRAHIDYRRHSAPGSRSIAALLKLHTACDLKLAGDVTRVEHYVQATLAFEIRVELVKQFANSGGEIRHGRAPAHDGDRLFRNLLDFDRVSHPSILAESTSGSPKR